MSAGSSSTANGLPRELGYQMPAEWEPHAATWLTWPNPEGISFPGRFEPMAGLWLSIVERLALHEQVHINTSGEQQEASIRELLARTPKRLK